MSFKDAIKEDATAVFLNTNEFAETIVYTPKNGVGKSIKAIVDRERISPADEDSGRVLLNQVKILIANDATYGVISIVKGTDQVSLPEVVGGTAIDWVVMDILGQDEGMWQLLLQK
ncbi:MAG: hypothetical protein WC369_02100 [Dehalococcoidales bacterium]|jgi:hypothetical protein